jgi:hypothetical protein
MAGKQPNQVRGNIIKCPNFVQCSLCYGCRNYDSRIQECRDCYEQGIRVGQNRNFNVCNKQLHTEEALNKMKHTHKIELKNCKIKRAF